MIASFKLVILSGVSALPFDPRFCGPADTQSKDLRFVPRDHSVGCPILVAIFWRQVGQS